MMQGVDCLQLQTPCAWSCSVRRLNAAQHYHRLSGAASSGKLNVIKANRLSLRADRRFDPHHIRDQ